MRDSRRLRMDLARYYRLPSVQVSLGVVLAFLISALFIMFAIRPTFATIVSLQRQVADSKTTLASLDGKVASLAKAETILDRIKPQLVVIEDSTPSDGVEYDQVARSLEALAQNTGVVLDALNLGSSIISSQVLSPYTPNKNQEVVNAPITLRVSGNYAQIVAFLTRLATTLRLTEMDSVTLQTDGSAAKGVSQGSLSLTVTGNIYYVVDKGVLNKLIPPAKGAK